MLLWWIKCQKKKLKHKNNSIKYVSVCLKFYEHQCDLDLWLKWINFFSVTFYEQSLLYNETYVTLKLWFLKNWQPNLHKVKVNPCEYFFCRCDNIQMVKDQNIKIKLTSNWWKKSFQSRLNHQWWKIKCKKESCDPSIKIIYKL